MPEGLEAEIWRSAMHGLVGRRVERVEADDRVADPGVHDWAGERIVGVRRHGKVVVVDSTGASIGLRFGMTGRVVVDGVSPIASLAYASSADRPEWDRLRVWTGGPVPALRLNDPRRLGRIEVDPDLDGLGPDVLTIDAPMLEGALRGRRSALKSALMNQAIVAGLGNLCVDEVLFGAGLAPTLPAGSLSSTELAALHRSLGDRLPAMLAAGGSTEGTLDPLRRRELGRCPADGCAGHLVRTRLGGRSTVWCPQHQRSEPRSPASARGPSASVDSRRAGGRLLDR